MDSVLSFYRQERCGDKCLARGLPQTEWLFLYSDYFAVTNTEDFGGRSTRWPNYQNISKVSFFSPNSSSIKSIYGFKKTRFQ